MQQHRRIKQVKGFNSIQLNSIEFNKNAKRTESVTVKYIIWPISVDRNNKENAKVYLK